MAQLSVISDKAWNPMRKCACHMHGMTAVVMDLMSLTSRHTTSENQLDVHSAPFPLLPCTSATTANRQTHAI